MKKFLRDLLLLTAGSFLFALAINLFIIPNELGEGGVTGLAIIAYYLFQWPTGIVYFTLNVLLLAIGYKFLDKKTTFYTIITICLLSLFLFLTEKLSVQSGNVMVNAIFGGVFSGAGIGLVIRAGGTTAGSTILAKMAHKYWDWNTAYALLLFDLVIVLLSYFIIGAESVMLTVVMLYAATKVMDFIHEGLNSWKAVTIIARDQSALARLISQEIKREVIVWNGASAQGGESKQMLRITATKQEAALIKKLVRAHDEEAAVTVQDVRECS